MNATTVTQEIGAIAKYRSDWDEDGSVSVHLPLPAAVTLLGQFGWTRESNVHPWVSPHGARFWETDEALQIALVAQTVQVPR